MRELFVKYIFRGKRLPSYNQATTETPRYQALMGRLECLCLCMCGLHGLHKHIRTRVPL